MTALDPDQFDACFDRFTVEAFRLETRPQYLVDEETERIAAFRRGEARPERSVRTSPWLRRIAADTIAGKAWRVIHAVQAPLSDYLTYQLNGYAEAQAAGEEVRLLATSDTDPYGTGDFWLFDGDTSAAYAIALHYDDDGRYLGADLVTDPDRLDRYRHARHIWTKGTTLNEFLAWYRVTYGRTA